MSSLTTKLVAALAFFTPASAVEVPNREEKIKSMQIGAVGSMIPFTHEGKEYMVKVFNRTAGRSYLTNPSDKCTWSYSGYPEQHIENNLAARCVEMLKAIQQLGYENNSAFCIAKDYYVPNGYLNDHGVQGAIKQAKELGANFLTTDDARLEAFQAEFQTNWLPHIRTGFERIPESCELDFPMAFLPKADNDLIGVFFDRLDARTLQLDSIPNLSADQYDARYRESCFDLDEIIDISAQSISALKKVHDKELVHRDIKTDNILVNIEDRQKAGRVVKVTLTDFDTMISANEMADKLCLPYVADKGTPSMFAPELVRHRYGPMELNELEVKDFSNRDDVYKVDVYALGRSLFELVAGNFLFAVNQTTTDSMNFMKQKENLHLKHHFIPDPQQDLHLWTDWVTQILLENNMSIAYPTMPTRSGEDQQKINNLLEMFKMMLRWDPSRRPSCEQLLAFMNTWRNQASPDRSVSPDGVRHVDVPVTPSRPHTLALLPPTPIRPSPRSSPPPVAAKQDVGERVPGPPESSRNLFGFGTWQRRKRSRNGKD